MTIMPMSSSGIAIFLDSTDLHDTNTVDINQAAELVSTAFDKLGMDHSGNLEIETYTGRDEVMILARTIPVPAAVFEFSTFDDVLAACLQSRFSCRDSSLICFDGKYYLCIQGSLTGSLCPLWEFGHRVEEGELYITHLSEHGHCLISRNALTVLKEYFSS